MTCNKMLEDQYWTAGDISLCLCIRMTDIVIDSTTCVTPRLIQNRPLVLAVPLYERHGSAGTFAQGQ